MPATVCRLKKTILCRESTEINISAIIPQRFIHNEARCCVMWRMRWWQGIVRSGAEMGTGYAFAFTRVYRKNFGILRFYSFSGRNIYKARW